MKIKDLLNKIEQICYEETDNFYLIKMINEPKRIIIKTENKSFSYSLFKKIFYSGIHFYLIDNKMIIDKDINTHTQ